MCMCVCENKNIFVNSYLHTCVRVRVGVSSVVSTLLSLLVIQAHSSVIRCWAFISVGVGKCQSEDSFVCFGAKPTQRACARNFPRDRKRTREGRSQS